LEKLSDIEQKEQTKPIKKLPYVTVHGEIPKEPIGFFQTKKFWVSGVSFGVFIGVATWIIIVTRH
jgi:hypothetical protein